MRLCEVCFSELDAEMRVDARFCSSRCRKKAYHESLFATTPRVPIPPEIRKVCQQLREHSTEHMVGYRLGLYDEKTETYTWFPAEGRTKRYDGSYDSRPYFELRPRFELPRVPVTGIYHIRFVANDNMVMEPPNTLSGGTYIPMATPMCLPNKKQISRKRPRVMI